MSPRSILKQNQSRTDAQQHVVHFPPSPALCSTFSAYSPSLYDRSPIVVSQNVCALPERGGRTYHITEAQCPRTSQRSPRSEASRAYRGREGVPQLVPDISSSESDESDTFIQPPPMPNHGLYSYGVHGLPAKYDYNPAVYSPTQEPSVDTLSFLPYPPSPPGLYDKAGRRRRHDGAVDMDRIRRDNHSGSSTSEEEHPHPTTPPKKRSSSRRREYLNRLSAGGSAGYGVPDDGCLGGF